jgi:hypothetical protein
MATVRWHWKMTRIGAEGEEREGPAWIVEDDGTEHAIEDGHWITRTQAESLATEKGYSFSPEE